MNHFLMFYATCNKVHNFGTCKHLSGKIFTNHLFVKLILLCKPLLNVSHIQQLYWNDIIWYSKWFFLKMKLTWQTLFLIRKKNSLNKLTWADFERGTTFLDTPTRLMPCNNYKHRCINLDANFFKVLCDNLSTHYRIGFCRFCSL
jgi:hypothetical protein